jgi:hypothetical protein
MGPPLKGGVYQFFQWGMSLVSEGDFSTTRWGLKKSLCVMCYTGISAAAGMAADRMKATAAHSRAIHGSRVRWVTGSAST